MKTKQKKTTNPRLHPSFSHKHYHKVPAIAFSITFALPRSSSSLIPIHHQLIPFTANNSFYWLLRCVCNFYSCLASILSFVARQFRLKSSRHWLASNPTTYWNTLYGMELKVNFARLLWAHHLALNTKPLWYLSQIEWLIQMHSSSSFMFGLYKTALCSRCSSSTVLQRVH